MEPSLHDLDFICPHLRTLEHGCTPRTIPEHLLHIVHLKDNTGCFS